MANDATSSPESSKLCQICGTPESSSGPCVDLPPKAPDILLRSNDAPSLTQHNDIRSGIESVTHAIEAFDSRIKHLRFMLSACEAEKTKYIDYLVSHKRVISSIRMVPSEIWSEIFQIGTDSWYNEGIAFRSSLSSNSFPLSCAQVSRSWRQIATTTPGLWRRVKLRIDLPLRSKGSKLLDLILEWSSGSDLVIFLSEAFTGVYFNAAVAALNALLLHSHRWSDVTIECSSFTVMQANWPVISAPRLQRLCLHYTNHLEGNPASPSQFITDDMALTNFTFAGDPVKRSFLAWSHLTDITLGDTCNSCSVLDVSNVLLWAESLSRLSLTCDEFSTGTIASIVHNSLTYLCINGLGTFCLRHFTMPSLKTLELRDIELEAEPSLFEHVPNFISRCGSLNELITGDTNPAFLSDLVNDGHKSINRLAMYGSRSHEMFSPFKDFLNRFMPEDDSSPKPLNGLITLHFEIITNAIEYGEEASELFDSFISLGQRLTGSSSLKDIQVKLTTYNNDVATQFEEAFLSLNGMGSHFNVTRVSISSLLAGVIV